jgi:hypothetical protein
MSVESLLALIFEGSANNEVDSVLANFEELKRISTVADLPVLISAMQSEQSDFWLRELLSEPIAQIGGCNYLPILFDALQKGEDEGHDNDGFCFHVTEMAASDPISCRVKLEAMIAAPGHKHKDKAEWLLEFCVP